MSRRLTLDAYCSFCMFVSLILAITSLGRLLPCPSSFVLSKFFLLDYPLFLDLTSIWWAIFVLFWDDWTRTEDFIVFEFVDNLARLTAYSSWEDFPVAVLSTWKDLRRSGSRLFVFLWLPFFWAWKWVSLFLSSAKVVLSIGKFVGERHTFLFCYPF